MLRQYTRETLPLPFVKAMFLPEDIQFETFETVGDREGTKLSVQLDVGGHRVVDTVYIYASYAEFEQHELIGQLEEMLLELLPYMDAPLAQRIRMYRDVIITHELLPA